MEAISNFSGISIIDGVGATPEGAALMEYLTIPTSVNFLRGLGFKIPLPLLNRYLAEEKINLYVWLDSTPQVTPLYSGDDPGDINARAWLDVTSHAIVKPCFIKAKNYELYFSSDRPGYACRKGKTGEIFAAIYEAESIVNHAITHESTLARWEPENHFAKIALLKVSELLEFVKTTTHLISKIEGLRDQNLSNMQSCSDAKAVNLEEENKLLKKQLKSNPANSTLVIAGALIELLTEQKTPRRNQTRIKLELEDKGLKGLSKASLDNLFSAANKALKASKDAG